MAGIAESEYPVLRIQHPVDCSDKDFRSGALVEQVVDLVHDASDGVVVSDLGNQAGPERGHDQGCGYPFPRHVRYGNSHLILHDGNEIVIISAYLLRRHVDARDIEPLKLRFRPWQEALLDPFGDG